MTEPLTPEALAAAADQTWQDVRALDAPPNVSLIVHAAALLRDRTGLPLPECAAALRASRDRLRDNIAPGLRHLTASMVVIDPNTEQVLLVWHLAYARLQFPGGHLEPDEAPAEAALREVHEETGVHARLVPTGPTLGLPGMVQRHCPWMIHEIPAPPKPARGPNRPAQPAHSHIDLLYVGTADSTLPLTDEHSGTTAPCWQPVDTLDRLSTRAEVPEVARRALSVVQTHSGDRSR